MANFVIKPGRIAHDQLHGGLAKQVVEICSRLKHNEHVEITCDKGQCSSIRSAVRGYAQRTGRPLTVKLRKLRGNTYSGIFQFTGE
jgi:hypothetical protein